MLRDAHYFAKAVEEHGFSAAASTLGINPSTVSRSINNLEKEFGRTFFKRNTRPSTMTCSGNTYYDYLTQKEQLDRQLIERLGNADKGYISIGFTYPVDWTIAQIVIDKFVKLYPDPVLQSKYFTCSNLNSYLADGTIDIAISPHILYMDGIELVSTIKGARWGLVIPSGMPQAKKPGISAEDLKQLPLITHEDKRIIYMLESHLQVDLSKSCGTYDSSSCLLGMLENGYGAGFITSNEKKHFESSKMKFIPLYPALDATFYVYCKTYSALNVFSQTLYDEIANTTLIFKEKSDQPQM